MSVEKRSEDQPYLEPTVEEQWEKSFGVAIRKAIDDLFTYQPIAERLQQSEGDERAKLLVSEHKLILVEQIEELAGRTITELLDQLSPPQAQPGLPLSALPDWREDVDNRVE
jgi:hypothetical protein